MGSELETKAKNSGVVRRIKCPIFGRGVDA